MLSCLRSPKFHLVWLLSLAVLLGGQATSPASAESYLAAEESKMVSMINSHRAKLGLPPVTVNDAFRGVARRHSVRMRDRGGIYHNPNLANEAEQAVPNWRYLGENVGVGPSTEAVQQAFLNSPKHRANIETRRFNVIGLGAVRHPDGRIFFTQNFADWPGSQPAPKATPQPTPKPQPVQQPPAKSAPAPARPAPAVQPVPARRPVQPAKPAVTAKPVPTAAPQTAPPAQALEDALGKLPGGEQPADQDIVAVLLSILVRFVEQMAFWA